jgi:hypothetical protein
MRKYATPGAEESSPNKQRERERPNVTIQFRLLHLSFYDIPDLSSISILSLSHATIRTVMNSHRPAQCHGHPAEVNSL